MVGQKLKILFLEDEPDIVELYKIVFEEKGFEMESVSSGKEMLKYLERFAKNKSGKPDIMIIDILLPDISGLDILKTVRRNSDFDDVFIIMFTNYSSDKIRKEVSGVKNVRYILKTDVTPERLAKIVEEETSQIKK